MRDFYIVGKKNLEVEIPNSPEWPKIIGYCYERKDFIFIEGNGYGFNGIILPEINAGEPRWNDLFDILNAKWFLSLIKDKPDLDKASVEAQINLNLGFIEIIKS